MLASLSLEWLPAFGVGVSRERRRICAVGVRGGVGDCTGSGSGVFSFSGVLYPVSEV